MQRKQMSFAGGHASYRGRTRGAGAGPIRQRATPGNDDPMWQHFDVNEWNRAHYGPTQRERAEEVWKELHEVRATPRDWCHRLPLTSDRLVTGQGAWMERALGGPQLGLES